MLPDQPKAVLTPPAPPVLAAIKASFAELRKRARVLIVLDVSGSMGADVGTAGRTKLELARSAASTALDAFAKDDEVGLWVFSSNAGGGRTPYAELVPIAPISQGKAQLQKTLAGLVPGGGTALYATTREAQKEMRTAFDPARINAVVLLTDGVNDYPPDSDLKGLRHGPAERERRHQRAGVPDRLRRRRGPHGAAQHRPGRPAARPTTPPTRRASTRSSPPSSATSDRAGRGPAAAPGWPYEPPVPSRRRRPARGP